MPELRRDPIIGRWVIISTERAKRPNQFGVIMEQDAPAPGEKCPLCEGNEHMTHPEIAGVRRYGTAPNTPGWSVRVVPARNPILGIDGDLDRHGSGMYDLMNARGAHEIIIERPQHHFNPETDPIGAQNQLALNMQVIIDRIKDLEKDPRIKYVLVFKNYGKAAGEGYFGHPHMQIMATPVNLKRVKEELVGSKQYYEYRERCIFCDIIKQEVQAGQRIMVETKHFIVIAPFASRFPFESWLLPKKHSCDFYKIGPAEIEDLAQTISLLYAKARKVIGDFPYNALLHTAPFRRRSEKKGYWDTIEYDFHWHFEFLPVLSHMAGFEWGSGFYINPLPPEDATKAVREAVI